MRTAISLLASLLLSFSLVACGEEGGTSEAQAAVTSPADAPEFAIPAAPGHSQVSLQNPTQLHLEYPGADFERVVAYYDAWADTQPGAILRTAAKGVAGWSNGVTKGDGVRSISVTRQEKSADGEEVTLVILIAS